MEKKNKEEKSYRVSFDVAEEHNIIMEMSAGTKCEFMRYSIMVDKEWILLDNIKQSDLRFMLHTLNNMKTEIENMIEANTMLEEVKQETGLK